MTQNKIFYKFVGLILKPFVKLIFPYEIYGAENLSIIKIMLQGLKFLMITTLVAEVMKTV